MKHTEVIQQFCQIVNDGLSQRKDSGRVAYEQLIPRLSRNDQKSLLDQLYQNYSLAQEPDNFSTLRLSKLDERFEQCYELMRITFDEAELESRETHLNWLELLQKGLHPFPLIMIGRFWHVSGSQQYGTDGQLQKYSFDRLSITDSIASVISGNYMQLLSREKESVGAIGQLATRSHFRRARGHGTALLEAFEREVEAIAAARGEQLQLIALEAQKDSWPFWAKRGYRWPARSHYYQPPLEFDPLTGEYLHDKVPELLMVKMWHDPTATHIDSRLLIDTVRTIYQNWCLAKVAMPPFTEEARQRATDYVLGKILTEFVASLPSEGEPIPLQDPPDSEV